jgi:hypothetical protein
MCAVIRAIEWTPRRFSCPRRPPAFAGSVRPRQSEDILA